MANVTFTPVGDSIARNPERQAYQILHLGFVAAPVLAGLDKFSHLLTNWDAYLAPPIANIAFAQTQAGPKLTQILRNDLEGQGQVVQETVVSLVEFPPGSAAPWHMHPGAQELLHVIEGSLIVEMEGKGRAVLEAGQAGLIPAELVHLARNESASATGKALVVHSRAAKDKPLIVVVKK